MGRKKKRMKVGTCAYCGRKGEVEKEHVFPRALFPKGHRLNLITVPSCRQCNKNYQKDEEYFKFMMVIAFPSFEGSEYAKAIWPKIEAMMRRDESRRFLANVLGKWKQVDIVIKGIYLGTAPALELDWNRIAGVITKFVKGLYFYHQQKALDNETRIIVRGFDIEQIEKFLNETDMKPYLPSLQKRSVGPGTVKYAFAIAGDNPKASWWIFNFYDNYITFMAFTKP